MGNFIGTLCIAFLLAIGASNTVGGVLLRCALSVEVYAVANLQNTLEAKPWFSFDQYQDFALHAYVLTLPEPFGIKD